jgi:hypothetical protein
MNYKEETYASIMEALNECTLEDTDLSAAIVIVDNEKNTVRVFGLNMDEYELPVILLEAAEEVSERITKQMRNRTINLGKK